MRITRGNDFPLIATLKDDSGMAINASSIVGLEVMLSHDSLSIINPVEFTVTDKINTIITSKEAPSSGVYRLIVKGNLNGLDIYRNPVAFEIVLRVEEESNSSSCLDIETDPVLVDVNIVRASVSTGSVYFSDILNLPNTLSGYGIIDGISLSKLNESLSEIISSGVEKLITPRMIFGQLFDGTSDLSGTITGSLYGNATSASILQSARLITIGNASKTFDGSTDLTFTIDEIGLTVGSGGGSSTAESADRLTNPRAIWGQPFDGTADVFGALTDVTTITTTSNALLGGGVYTNGLTSISEIKNGCVLSNGYVYFKNSYLGGIVCHYGSTASTTHSITFTSSNVWTVYGHWRPTNNNSHRLGDESYRWSGVYGVNANFTGESILNSLTVNGSATFLSLTSAGITSTGGLSVAGSAAIAGAVKASSGVTVTGDLSVNDRNILAEIDTIKAHLAI